MPKKLTDEERQRREDTRYNRQMSKEKTKEQRELDRFASRVPVLSLVRFPYYGERYYDTSMLLENSCIRGENYMLRVVKFNVMGESLIFIPKYEFCIDGVWLKWDQIVNG